MTVDEFLALLHDHIALPVTVRDMDRPLDDVPGWDSLNLIWLAAEMARRCDRGVDLPDLLEAPSLRAIHQLYAGG
ncbi:acyl carrier protein [Actinoplanes sp. KI2]|uniref:acyl carrier protein n=1 Tax=Actinoplanes sp. KI2 TaxID=2983315 RepID=UPI0021D5A7DC|nr:acyl carrier protein [Actinoplanes sp. KI2]MCU7725982.1 acyl carrier protein [Actinoplanes sp. KI2]